MTGNPPYAKRMGQARPAQFRCRLCNSIYSVRTGTPEETYGMLGKLKNLLNRQMRKARNERL